jgi:phosphatidylserine decarboxylase
MAGDLLDSEGRGEILSTLPRVHPEGRKFALAAAGLSLLFAFLAWETLAWPMAFLSVGILAFFRDPDRVVPQDERFIVSPADGRIAQITQVEAPHELVVEDGSGSEGLPAGPITRVSIFLSVFDVHINRTPISGMVRRLVYIPGKFINADLDKASEDNERQLILIERSDGVKVGFAQIAGLIARRIVPFVKPGDTLGVGQRVGMIRFGSRVDVYLPAGTGSKVMLGQKVVAGETVIAEIGNQTLLEGVSQ